LRVAFKILTTVHQLTGLLLTLAGMGDEGMSVSSRLTLYNLPALSNIFIIYMLTSFNLQVNIWGPSDLKYLVDAMRSFIPNAAMVHTKSFGPTFGTESTVQCQSDPIVLVDDEVVKISAIILQPCQSPSQRTDHSTDIADSLNGKKLAAKPGDMSVVYVCELPEIMGKFDPEKAKALGLRPGPKYRELQLGNSVESDCQKNVMVSLKTLTHSIPKPGCKEIYKRS
jgi:ribonuclease Z